MAQEKRCLPRLMASREEGQGSRPAAQDASPRARRGPGSANLPRRVTAAPPTSWTSHPSPVKQPVGCGKEEQPALRRRVPSPLHRPHRVRLSASSGVQCPRPVGQVLS